MSLNVVFTDNWGTLSFLRKEHHIKEMERLENGNVLVQQPDCSNSREVFDVSNGLYGLYLDTRTRILATLLAQDADIVMVSGMRPVHFKPHLARFDFLDTIVLEHGAAIYDKNMQPDPEWKSQMEPDKRQIAPMIAFLKSQGLTLDLKGRDYAICIRRMDNLNLTPEMFQELYEKLSLPDGLQKTINVGNIHIFPASAGKEKAAKYGPVR